MPNFTLGGVQMLNNQSETGNPGPTKPHFTRQQVGKEREANKSREEAFGDPGSRLCGRKMGLSNSLIKATDTG